MIEEPATYADHRCPTCGRAAPGGTADLRVYAAGPPRCCGRATPEPAPAAAAAGRPRDRRRPARPGTRVDVRRPGADPGPDLGTKLTDLSATEAGVRLATAIPGDEVLVGLVGADHREVARLPARVRWCRPLGGGVFAAGLEFGRPLTLTELARLVL